MKTKTITKEILKNACHDIILDLEKYALDCTTTKFVLAQILKAIELEETSDQNKNQKGI